MVGTTVSLRPQLTIGSENVRVVVSAEQPLIDATRSSASSVIGQGTIENLPLNGRDFSRFRAAYAGGDYRWRVVGTPYQHRYSLSGLSTPR